MVSMDMSDINDPYFSQHFYEISMITIQIVELVETAFSTV